MTSSNSSSQNSIEFNIEDHLQEIKNYVQNAGLTPPAGATWSVDIHYGLVRFHLIGPAVNQGLTVTMNGVKVGTHKEVFIASEVGPEFVKVLQTELPSPVLTISL